MPKDIRFGPTKIKASFLKETRLHLFLPLLPYVHFTQVEGHAFFIVARASVNHLDITSKRGDISAFRRGSGVPSAARLKFPRQLSLSSSRGPSINKNKRKFGANVH